MNPDNIRRDLNNYLQDNGIKSKFIASKIGISESMMSYFLNNKKSLSVNNLQKIYNIIYK